jgi:hypothetical protein
MAAMSPLTQPGQGAAASGAKALTQEQRHRILISAAVAVALDGPFRIVNVERAAEPENRWGKSGRFRNRTPRPPSWTTHAVASAEFAAAEPAPKSEAPQEQGGHRS